MDSESCEQQDSESATSVEEVTEAREGKNVIHTHLGPVYEFEATEENIPMHPSILAAGKRRTGKSTSLDNLMEKTMQHIPFGIVMTETKMNGFWQTRVPERFVFQGWREDILIKLVERQKMMIKKYGKEDPRTFAFIVLDDVIADQKAIRWSKTINSFFVEGRHINITVLLTTQYMKGIGPMVRGNMDIVFLQPIYSLLDRQTIQELYGGFLPKKDFMQLMDEIVMTEEQPGSTAYDPKLKVRIMVVQDWRQTCDVSLKFKYWVPVHSKEVPPYRLCHPDYWKKSAEEEIDDLVTRPPRKALVDTIDEVSILSGVSAHTYKLGDGAQL